MKALTQKLKLKTIEPRDGCVTEEKIIAHLLTLDQKPNC